MEQIKSIALINQLNFEMLQIFTIFGFKLKENEQFKNYWFK